VGDTASALRERVSGGVGQATDAVADRYAATRDKAQDAIDQGRRALHEGEDQAIGLARDAQGKAMALAEDTRQSVARLISEQPILVAALGAALGAAIGAALPLSRQEKDMLSGVGAKAVGMGREALSGAAGVLSEEVGRADIGAKVGQLADKVMQGVKDSAQKS
jgi:hypothetical protein